MAPQQCFDNSADNNQLKVQHESNKSVFRSKAKQIMRACEGNNRIWISALLKDDSRHPTVLNNESHKNESTEEDLCDSDGWTGLHWASRHNNTDIVSSLLKAGASINQASRTGDTALILTAMYGNTATGLQLLKTKGCAIDAVNKDGYSALMYACRYNHILLAEALIEAGATITTCHPLSGDDGLALACKNGHQHIVKMLINAGAVQLEQSTEFQNALQKAKDEETSALLLKETRWFLRKPFLMTLTQSDVIPSSISKTTTASPATAATFKPPSVQEMVFFNLYREVAMFL